jgi:hypothetical protein
LQTRMEEKHLVSLFVEVLLGKCKHSEVTLAQALGGQVLSRNMARNSLVRSLP